MDIWPLADREKTVNEIAEPYALSLATVSKHLKVQMFRIKSFESSRSSLQR